MGDELALLQLIVLALIVGTFLHPAFLTQDQPRQHPAAVLGIVGPRARRGDHPDRRQVRSVAGVDRRRRADVRGVAGDRHGDERIGLDAQSLSRDRRAVCRRPGRRRLQRLAHRPPRAQRLHLDAGDADPAPRRVDRLDERQDALRPARAASSISATPIGSACPLRSGCRERSIVVGSFILGYHRFGRALYAIGGNAEAARAAGIRVDQYVWTVFVIGGGLAALSGLMLTGRMASVLSGQGQNMIFTVFAAAVIGRHQPQRRQGFDPRRALRRDPASASSRTF